MAAMSLSKGDKVSWKTPQGTTTGTTVEKKIKPFQHDKQQFNASEDDPYWIVKSEKSGSTAAHKESSLDGA